MINEKVSIDFLDEINAILTDIEDTASLSHLLEQHFNPNGNYKPVDDNFKDYAILNETITKQLNQIALKLETLQKCLNVKK
jgi:hypothetical protein